MIDFDPGNRCPHCSFDPTSQSDYCDKHRPKIKSETSDLTPQSLCGTLKPMIDTENLTKQQRSVLLYAETCLVDYGGLIQGSRINRDDTLALTTLQESGILKFGRIPFRTLETIPINKNENVREMWRTHWVEFDDQAWEIAHALRRQRAARKSVSRALVDASLQE